MKFLTILSLILLCQSLPITAESTYTFAEVEVVGGKDDIKDIPGSAVVVSKEDLSKQQPNSVSEALSQVSGVSIRDEEGLGLRPNISLRGVPGDRSRKILMLEDGVPISLAPYGENAAYYAPAIERVESIEVRKGSGSIAYGPQTIGGVVNFKTPNPPKETEVNTKLIGGNHGYKSIQTSYGGTFNDTGILVSALHKQGDGPRSPMPFIITDLTGKMHNQLTPKADLTLKLHYYNEDGRVSYTGLTQSEYEADSHQNTAVNDSLYVERVGFSGIHNLNKGEDSQLKTSFYTHFIKRDWWRQDKESSLDSKGNTVYKDTNGGRNRYYKVAGIEPRYTKGNFESGLKFHFEEEDNKRINGNSPTARTARKGLGSDDGLVDHEKRSTLAGSMFAQYTFEPNAKLKVVPGIRVESFNQERLILMNKTVYKTATVNGVLSDITKPISTKTGWTSELIPGIGLIYDHNDTVNMFAGVHRGFAPPRFSDAINSSAEDQKLESEKSWNYEAGVRSKLLSWLKADATVFYYDYENQVINASESSGHTKTNSGESTSAGVELDLIATNDDVIPNVSTEVALGLTYTDAIYQTNITDGKGNTLDTKGNRIPYVSKGMAALGFTVSHNSGVTFFLEALYKTAQYTDSLNTANGSENGKLGTIAAHTVLNLSASYKVSPTIKTFVAVKNLLDETYIASRSPEGIFPGISRQINVGIHTTF